MKNMTWNQDAYAYQGTTSEGRTVSVAGDYWQEEKGDGINALIQERCIDRNALSPEEDDELIDKLENEVLAEFDDPDWWALSVGDNPNVEYVD
jgi:hypothetical protein